MLTNRNKPYHCFSLILILLFPFLNCTAISSAAIEDAKYEPSIIRNFAKMVETSLAKNSAKVAILSRVGKPMNQLPDGLKYTHVGIAVYSNIVTPSGNKKGYIIYNLYQNSNVPNRSDLYRDFPFDFFYGVHTLKTGIIIPTHSLQKKVYDVIFSDKYKMLHNPRYSVISNPFNSTYQNCTEHTMDVVQAAIYGHSNIAQLKRNLSAYFKPYEVPINSFNVFLGSIFSKDISIDDHPKRPFKTGTYTSIKKYFDLYHLASKTYEIEDPRKPKYKTKQTTLQKEMN